MCKKTGTNLSNDNWRLRSQQERAEFAATRPYDAVWWNVWIKNISAPTIWKQLQYSRPAAPTTFSPADKNGEAAERWGIHSGGRAFFRSPFCKRGYGDWLARAKRISTGDTTSLYEVYRFADYGNNWGATSRITRFIRHTCRISRTWTKQKQRIEIYGQHD